VTPHPNERHRVKWVTNSIVVRVTPLKVATLVKTIQAKEDPVRGIQDKPILGKEIQDRPSQVKIDPIKVASGVLTKTTVNRKTTKESPA